jgi:F-type H+-transporting ATPase subunit alpha
VAAGSVDRAPGHAPRVPVGPALLGRILDATGRPLDDGPPVRAERWDPIERPAPAIVDRDLVAQPLATGITVIDAMIPLGRGQRQLVIGDRKTGKTAVALDTMLNQRRSDVICVYAGIGQKGSSVRQVVDAVRAHGVPERTVFVIARADDPPGAQWLAPYAACTIAEHFRDRGQHALLVLDNLTEHAVVYRELALLLRLPPGREAYPGDIFYLHARLLERAAKLSPELGGGSLSALPIAETQAGNLSAYIPTNLISITDGQIYLEPRLFYEGQKPAVNVGLSVSRVGGRTQPKALRQLAERLRLDYAQFLELEAFARFGSLVDERTRRALERGRRIRAILRQPQMAPLGLGEEVALLLAVSQGRLDPVPEAELEALLPRLLATLASMAPHLLAEIDRSGELVDATRAGLLAAIDAGLAGLRPAGG